MVHASAMKYDRLWERLIEYVNEWADACEVPGGIEVTFETAAGATRTVEVVVAADALRFWDVRVHDWALPRGAVDLEVARSSETIEAVVAIEVLGAASDSAEGPSTAAIAASDEQWARRLGRAIPNPAPSRPFTRESTLGDIGGTLVGRTLRNAVVRMAPVSDEDRADPASLALIERSIDELPLRGLAQMSQGKMSWAVVDAVVALANRRPLRAVATLLRRRRR